MSRPLDGIRVLDFTRVLSGPHAARMLCDLGADVIKVEPPTGDTTRFATPKVNSFATYFIQQNVGKRNVSMDMTKPAALELLLQLSEHCDVVLENFRPGVMARMGLGYEAIAARNPTVIYASISGYGQTGPWVHRRAYAPVVGAESGFTKLQGDARGGSYANDPHSNADVYTGMECAAAVLAALYQRERTGHGECIDVSMAETMLYVNEHVQDQLWDGEVKPDWIRSFGPGDYPVIAAANGETVIISGHPAERGSFAGYMAAIGQPERAQEARFIDVAARLAHLAEIIDLLRAWALTVPDADTIEAAMDVHGLATGQLRSVRDLAATDWAADRGAIVDVSDRGSGTVRVPNSPWHFRNAETGLHGEPRYRGEDNHDVLAELLGLSDDEIATLERDGVLSSRGPSTA